MRERRLCVRRRPIPSFLWQLQDALGQLSPGEEGGWLRLQFGKRSAISILQDSTRHCRWARGRDVCGGNEINPSSNVGWNPSCCSCWGLNQLFPGQLQCSAQAWLLGRQYCLSLQPSIPRLCSKDCRKQKRTVRKNCQFQRFLFGYHVAWNQTTVP